MDFIGRLPPEIVARILRCLDITDALHCRAVSQGWKEKVEGHVQYWERACRTVGLTQYKTYEYSFGLSLPRVAAAALKHRYWVTSSSSMVDSLVGVADCNPRLMLRILTARGASNSLSNSTCFLGHGYLVVSLQSPVDVRSVCTTSKAITKITNYYHNPELDMLTIKKVGGKRKLLTDALTVSNGWITWGKACPDYILFFAVSGKWIGYSPLTDAVLLEWEGGSSGLTQRGHLYGGGSCYSISCCDKCFLVVTAEALFSSSLAWELQILKVGKGQVEPEVVSMRTVLVKLQQEEKVLQWLLIPDVQNSEPGRKQELDFCPRHNLICICDTSISVYKVDLTLPEPKYILKTCQAQIPTCRCHILHPETGLPDVTSAHLSADNRLLACIMKPFHFYVWDAQTWERLTSVHFSWVHNRTANTSRVIAVGHLYSVVATFDSTPGGNLHIISTCSGELICERDARVQWYTHQGLDFIHLVNEDWLNDVFCCNAPFFVYLNQSTQAYVLSYVQFTHPAHPSQTKSWKKALFQQS